MKTLSRIATTLTVLLLAGSSAGVLAAPGKSLDRRLVGGWTAPLSADKALVLAFSDQGTWIMAEADASTSTGVMKVIGRGTWKTSGGTLTFLPENGRPASGRYSISSRGGETVLKVVLGGKPAEMVKIR